MGHYYSHLSKTDRYKIEAMLNAHCSKKEIAAELHVHISTVYREIKRARWVHLDGDTWIEEERYNPDGAEKRYRDNLAAKGAPPKIGNDFEFADYIENKILNEDGIPATTGPTSIYRRATAAAPISSNTTARRPTSSRRTARAGVTHGILWTRRSD